MTIFQLERFAGVGRWSVLLLTSLVLCVPSASSLAQTSAAAQAPVEYRLGAGDTVRISVYQNPDLTLDTRITDSGSISFPLLGAVRIGGLGVSQAEKLIADGLRNGNFVKQPQVNLTVLQVRGNQASVLGLVNRPGRYPIEKGEMRLSDLLATAGGTSSGGSETIVVTGARNGRPFRQEVDLPSIFGSSGSALDIRILDGDVVWVDRAPVVYIYGEVQRPGAMRLDRNMTVLQALAAGGGLNQRGTEKGLRVHRSDAGGKVQVLQPAMNDKLQDGDVVYVRESLF